jgi:hypothetical protein
MSDTFCVLPWIHLSTRPNGILRPCCTSNASSAGPMNGNFRAGLVLDDYGKPDNLNVSDFLTSWNGTYMKGVRKMMLNGEKPASCSKCYKEEDNGFKSKRQWETEYWSSRVNIESLIKQTKNGEVPPHITYLDLRFGHKCQLACIMCTPHDSSGWIKEWKEIFPQITNKELKDNFSWEDKGKINGSSFNWHKNNPKFWEQLYDQIPNMQQLYFAGGESLIIEEHYDLLEECIKRGHAGNLELRYNSNAVEWREDLFDLWKHFKLVRFHYSVDSLFEHNDYIRYPSKWKRTKEVMHILDKQTSDNVELKIACAVQFLNVFYLPDFIKWKLEQDFVKLNMYPDSGGGVDFHFVYLPPHLNVKVLPASFKQKVREKFESFYPWWEQNWKLGVKDNTTSYDEWRNNKYGINTLKGIVKFMESEDWSNRLPQTNQYLNLVDKTRKLDRYNIFPEMAVDCFSKTS